MLQWLNIRCTQLDTQPFYGSLDFVQDNPGEPVPEETFTHSHLSRSSVIPYLLSPSIMIHGILPVWFTCTTVFFHNLSPSFLCFTSWPGTLNFILHIFLHTVTKPKQIYSQNNCYWLLLCKWPLLQAIQGKETDFTQFLHITIYLCTS